LKLSVIGSVLGALVYMSRPDLALALSHNHTVAKATKGASRFVQVEAHSKEERTELANLGLSIEFVKSDSVWGFATPKLVKLIKQTTKFKVLEDNDKSVGRGGHQGALDFPVEDEKFHNYTELQTELKQLAQKYPNRVALKTIGKTTEGRDIFAVNINTSPEDLKNGHSSKAGVIFMGNHHAREHLSVEIPLMLAKHLAEKAGTHPLNQFIEARDIWIIPMVNPDGAEYDVASGKYKMWRKNRRNNLDGTYGVDLNRNYGFGWGTGGSSTDTDSDIYMGEAPFSEPETQAIRDFVKTKPNATSLLSFHTYSELILYPWGGKYESVPVESDRKTFETMALTMSKWNHYKPEQSSDLYIASGDTTDWAYGELGMFAFTFELSPGRSGGGGFYPGQKVIESTFKANLNPCLYMIEVANDPKQVLKPHFQSLLENDFMPLPKLEVNTIQAAALQ